MMINASTAGRTDEARRHDSLRDADSDRRPEAPVARPARNDGGPRLIALAIVTFVGVMAMAPGQTNIILYNGGDTVIRISVVLFVIEYALSFFH